MESLSAKVYCASCEKPTNHGIILSHITKSDIHDDFQWHKKYYIAQCLGCNEINFVTETGDEDMVDYDEEGSLYWYTVLRSYPEPPTVDDKEKKGTQLNPRLYDLVPGSLNRLYSQVVQARNASSLLLAAAGLRMIIEGICNDQDVMDGPIFDENGEPTVSEKGTAVRGKRLFARINGLVERGFITYKQSLILHQLRELGNTSVHEAEIPKKSVITSGIEIIEHIFLTIYEIDNYVISKKSKTPEEVI